MPYFQPYKPELTQCEAKPSSKDKEGKDRLFAKCRVARDMFTPKISGKNEGGQGWQIFGGGIAKLATDAQQWLMVECSPKENNAIVLQVVTSSLPHVVSTPMPMRRRKEGRRRTIYADTLEVTA